MGILSGKCWVWKDEERGNPGAWKPGRVLKAHYEILFLLTIINGSCKPYINHFRGNGLY
jgi:hypothetical protein